MVLLTMTSALVAAVKEYQSLDGEELGDDCSSEPSLLEPEVGDPISHGQIIHISKRLKKQDSVQSQDVALDYHLNTLLRGSQVYVPPPKPKREQTPEYKELMARLRRDEEQRLYQKMITPHPEKQSFRTAQNLSTQTEGSSNKEEEDEVTFAEVNRQAALIINVLLSIIACGVAIWVVARHWNAPSRLALSMGGSGAVGIAEVVVYAGYIRRLKEAKIKEKQKVEKKTITDTWVIGRNSSNKTEPIALSGKPSERADADGLRHRKNAPS